MDNREELTLKENLEEVIQKFCQSHFYIGNHNKLTDYCKNIDDCSGKCCNKEKERKFEKNRDQIRLRLKNYFELNNVSFLFGAGSSLMLGAVAIRDIPRQIEDVVLTNPSLCELFIILIGQYQSSYSADYQKENGDWKVQKKDDKIYRWWNGDQKGNIDIPLENFLDYLLGLQYISEFSTITLKYKKENAEKELALDKNDLAKLINLIKTELFILCDIDCHQDKLRFHKKFVKALLGRPLNLRRANIFTTNYDLAFEEAFEELGVHYINGFTGFNKRYIKPEVFDYDMYYPGSLTEGKVRRVEKVVKYYKLHGSLTWIKEKITPNNVYGLRELAIDHVRNQYTSAASDTSKIGDVIIYPTAYKKGYTLDFPYSELFRQFAAAITQTQSVLVCVGYSFFDDHINDIIFQALSIPSFTLIIVDLNGTKNPSIQKLKELNDPRIIIMEGKYLGDFKYFAEDIMPNFHELDIDEKVSKSLNALYPEPVTGGGKNA
jgi:hypothetical protein